MTIALTLLHPLQTSVGVVPVAPVSGTGTAERVGTVCTFVLGETLSRSMLGVSLLIRWMEEELQLRLRVTVSRAGDFFVRAWDFFVRAWDWSHATTLDCLGAGTRDRPAEEGDDGAGCPSWIPNPPPSGPGDGAPLCCCGGEVPVQRGPWTEAAHPERPTDGAGTCCRCAAESLPVVEEVVESQVVSW